MKKIKEKTTNIKEHFRFRFCFTWSEHSLKVGIGHVLSIPLVFGRNSEKNFDCSWASQLPNYYYVLNLVLIVFIQILFLFISFHFSAVRDGCIYHVLGAFCAGFTQERSVPGGQGDVPVDVGRPRRPPLLILPGRPSNSTVWC